MHSDQVVDEIYLLYGGLCGMIRLYRSEAEELDDFHCLKY